MAVDILSVSALHRTVEAKRDQVREQHRLRDSALAAVVADSAIVDSYNSLIDSVDSYITNFGSQSYGFQFDSYHSKYYGSGGEGIGGELNQKYLGIKRLCHYGAITSHVSIANTTTEYNCGQCCQVTVPAGVTRMGVTAIAPGGPSKMSNCCGFGAPGPTGHFASYIMQVSEGDVFAFCAGCANACRPYCCGYGLEKSCPTTHCSISGTYGTAMLVCLKSPDPWYCTEDRNRKWANINARCPGTTNLTGPYCCSGENCYSISYLGTQCMCPQCGTSGCMDGNDHGCFQFGNCSQENAENQCYGELPFQPDRLGDGGIAYCNSTAMDQDPYFNSIASAGIVPGSCYKVKGGWTGGMNRNNCWMGYMPPSPYGVSVLACDTSCRYCWTNCCPGCMYAAQCNIRCAPGLGGSPNLACGGTTGMYSDRGRMGAVCVQFC